MFGKRDMSRQLLSLSPCLHAGGARNGDAKPARAIFAAVGIVEVKCGVPPQLSFAHSSFGTNTCATWLVTAVSTSPRHARSNGCNMSSPGLNL
ncbi:hypothetical protein BABINDRAFT_162684, partial [Babjeviella inositovora NRRL Y-12698]